MTGRSRAATRTRPAVQLLEPRIVLTTFTMDSPIGLAPLSTLIPPAGGIVLDLIGTNGGRVETDLGPNHLYQGLVDSASANPLLLGAQAGLSSQILQSLGGGLSGVAVRLTMLQGATGPGESQQHSDFLLLNGISLGDLSDVATQQTNPQGLTSLSFNAAGGFRTGSLDTGFFSSSDPALLASLYQSIVQSGQVTYALQYRQPFDQLLDFRDGLDHPLANPVQPVILAFDPPRIESITTGSPIDEGGTATITVTAVAELSQPGESPLLTYQFDPSDSGTYSISNQIGVIAVSFPRPGSYLIPIRVITAAGSFALGQARIEVLNVAPIIAVAGNQTAIEGTPKSFKLGQFSDPGDDSPWTVSVNWGDGSSPVTFALDHTGSLGALTHTYGLSGSDTVALKVTDSLGATSLATFRVAVQDVPPLIDSLTATSPVMVGMPSALALRFSDPGSLETFHLVIDWGDHTSTSLMLGVGSRSFASSHVYAAAGTDAITVTITDHGGGQASGTATVLVVAPANSLSPTPFIPAVPVPLFTSLAFFNSPTSKTITPPSSNPPAANPALYAPNQGQGFGGTKPPSARELEGAPGKPWGRSLQEILALLMGSSSSSASTHAAGSGFSAFSTGSGGAVPSLGPSQSSGALPEELAQDESRLTGGKSTRILMLIVWTLSLRNQRQRRLGRRSLREKALGLK